MSDRNSPSPFEGGGTTPRTPTFDRDSPNYNQTPNEELVTPPLLNTVSSDRLPVLPFWKIREQSMKMGRMIFYQSSKEHLTKKVNDAVKKITDVKPSKTKLKLKVNRITLTASWKWRDSKDDDACGICRGAFEACCTNCKLPGDGCPLALGDCKHAFHLHCINKWIDSQSNPSCPLCRTEWKSAPFQRNRSPIARRSSASPPHSYSRTPNRRSNNLIIRSPPRFNYPAYTPGSMSHSPMYHSMEDRSPSARRSSSSPPHSYNRTPTPNPSSNNSIIVSPPQLNYPTYTPGSPVIHPMEDRSPSARRSSDSPLNYPTYSPHSPIYHPMEENPTYTPGSMPHSPINHPIEEPPTSTPNSIPYSPVSPIYHPMEED